jgi:dipeptidyl aminopeptidase/acylaminoacyl peptidase
MIAVVMPLRLPRPPRRLLLPALIVAVTAAVLTAGAPRLSVLHAAHPAHHAAAAVPPPGGRVAGPVLSSTTPPPPAVLTIASLRDLHQAATGPILPIGRPQPGPGYSLQRVAYHSQGLRVTATLLLPSTPGRHRLVIALHGLASPRTYRAGADAMPLAIPLARHGVLVGVPDYRGLGGGDPDPRTEALPLADAIDALTLLDLLRTDPRVDPAHIGVIGHSLGGNVGEIMLAAHTGIRAAVLYAPSESEYGALYLRRPSYFAGRPALGTPGREPALYQAMSPGSNFGRLHCNVLLEQGTADSIVPPHASIVASKELSASGATVRLTMVPGADHDLSQAVWGPGLAEGTSFLLQNL